MKPDIQDMFMDPCDRMKSIFKCYEFQTNHAKHTVSLQKKNLTTFGRQLKEVNEQSKHIKEERDKLKTVLERMKAANAQQPQPASRPLAPYNLARHQQQEKQQKQMMTGGRRTLNFQQKNFNPPQTFSDMAINAFSTKTPAAFKVGNVKTANQDGKNNDILRNFPF